DMISDMRHETSRHPSVKLNIVIFLRSDIFHHVQEIALEPDKLPVTYMAWSDREALMHLLDIRLEDALNGSFSAADIWSRLFVDTIDGISPREFIASWSIPRPRDVIYFLKQSIWTAISRGRSIVQEDDLYVARKAYSQ